MILTKSKISKIFQKAIFLTLLFLWWLHVFQFQKLQYLECNGAGSPLLFETVSVQNFQFFLRCFQFFHSLLVDSSLVKVAKKT